MGLRTSAQVLLAGWAARRPHVLLVTAPGGTAARLAVEAQARALGGVLTGEPADADVLVVAGSPDGELADAVAVLWSQIPAPKVRVDVLDSTRAAALLSAGIHRLASTPDAGAESTEPVEPMDEHVHQHEAEMGHEHGGDGGHSHGGHTDAGQGGHEHGGHAHGGMQMPGGLMMADRAPDRDGLKLDVLHVALGPVLPAWPSGLVIDVELQGDVVQAAKARVLAGAGDSVRFWADGTGVADGRCRAAAHLDSVGRLLEVAGWSGAVDRARGQRDALLTETDGPTGEAREELRRLRRRVERSWGLRRSLAGLGRLGPGDVSRLGLSGPAARAAERDGDAWARLQTWLVEADLALSSGPVEPNEDPRGMPGHGSGALVAAAAHLLPGLDLGDARLVVASLDPDPDDLHSAGVAGDRHPHSGHDGNGHHDEGTHGMPGGTNHQHDGHVA